MLVACCGSSATLDGNAGGLGADSRGRDHGTRDLRRWDIVSDCNRAAGRGLGEGIGTLKITYQESLPPNVC